MTQLSHSTLPAGAHVGLYEIKSVLHVGQEAITYRAWSSHVNASIVLKEYFPQQIAARSADGLTVTVADESEQANYQNGLAGFLELSEALQQIEHPNISEIQNSLEANGTAYMILDYIDRQSLKKYLAKGITFSETEALQLLMVLLDALKQVHNYSLIHGDIRPSNILINKDNAILVGFSVLSVAELYNPDLRPTAESDLYQLAEVIYQCLTKITPVALSDRLDAVRKGENDPLKLLQNSTQLKTTPAILQNIDNMLSLDQKQRAKTAVAASEALKASFSEEDVEQAGLLQTGDQSPELDINSTEIRPGVWLSLLGGIALLFVIGFYLLPIEPSQPVNTNTGKKVILEFSPEKQSQPAKAPVLVSEAKPDQQQELINPGLTKPELANAELSNPESENLETKNQVIVRTEVLQILEQEEVKDSATELNLTQTPVPVRQSAEPIKPAVQSKPNSVTPSSVAPNSMAPNSMAIVPPQMPTIDAVAEEASDDTQIETKSELTESNITTVAAINADPEAVSIAMLTSQTTENNKPVTNDNSISNWAIGKNLPLPERMQWHLMQAENNIAANRLTTPLQDNAYQHYRIVLVLDPDNQQAKAGMNKIIAYYSGLIERAIKEGRYRRAKIYLTRAEAVDKNSYVIKKYRKQLRLSPLSK